MGSNFESSTSHNPKPAKNGKIFTGYRDPANSPEGNAAAIGRAEAAQERQAKRGNE